MVTKGYEKAFLKFFYLLLPVIIIVTFAVSATTSINANELRDKIANSEIVSYENVVIKGDLIFNSVNLPAIILKNVEFTGDVDFTGCSAGLAFSLINSKFRGNTKFVKTRFLQNMDLSGSQFYLASDFNGAYFGGFANFENTTFWDSAGFGATRFNQDAIFKKSNFNGVADFENVVLTGNAYFQDTNFKNSVNFKDAKFNQDAKFSKVLASDVVSFSNATFNGLADFANANMQKSIKFSDSYFARGANFEEVTFGEITEFIAARFNQDAKFARSVFNGNADFRNSVLNGDADFQDTKLSGPVDFSNCKFKQDAIFRSSDFSNNATFNDMVVSGNSNFQDANFADIVDFRDSDFVGSANFEKANFNKQTSFDNTQFDKSSNFNGAGFDIVSFKNSRLGDCQFDAKFNGKLYFDQARFNSLYVPYYSIKNHLEWDNEAYISLRDSYKTQGWTDPSDEVERDRQWNIYIRSSFTGKYIILPIYWILGFGTLPAQVFIVCIGVIFIFSMFFYFKKGVKDALTFKEYLFHSTYAFLGMEKDVDWIGNCKYASLIEHILGWMLMAFFIYVLIARH